MKHEDFAERFRSALEGVVDFTLTQENVGQYFDVTPIGARNWLIGNKLPSMDNAIKISLKLGVCVEWLLTGRGPIKPTSKIRPEILRLAETINKLPEEGRKFFIEMVYFQLQKEKDHGDT